MLYYRCNGIDYYVDDLIRPMTMFGWFWLIKVRWLRVMVSNYRLELYT